MTRGLGAAMNNGRWMEMGVSDGQRQAEKWMHLINAHDDVHVIGHLLRFLLDFFSLIFANGTNDEGQNVYNFMSFL